MHLADGVLNLPVVAITSAVAVAGLAYSIKGIKEEEIPKISLTTAAFFVISLINIPVGPSSVHPILGGMVGLLLGKRAPLAFFIGLLLQAVLFQHGGLTTLGANTIMLAVPALLVYYLYYKLKLKSAFLKGFLAGSLAIAGTVMILVIILSISDQRFAEGFLSVVNILIIGHIPLAVIEGIITGFAVSFLLKVRPEMIERQN